MLFFVVFNLRKSWWQFFSGFIVFPSFLSHLEDICLYFPYLRVCNLIFCYLYSLYISIYMLSIFFSCISGLCLHGYFSQLWMFKSKGEASLSCNNLLPCKSPSTRPSFSSCNRNNGQSHFLEIPCVIIAHLPEGLGWRWIYFRLLRWVTLTGSCLPGNQTNKDTYFDSQKYKRG